MTSAKAVWSRRLAAIAQPVLVGTPLTEPADDAAKARFIQNFEDELGHRRPVDQPLLAAILGVHAPATAEPGSPDVAAWTDVCAGRDPARVQGGDGPLVYGGEEHGIEIGTETELAVLHALWRRGVTGPSAPARTRAIAAACWAIGHLQPDNATGHPWAVAVFIELCLATGSDEARLYAETLVHAGTVATGRPDRFSAVLLMDSARLLTLNDQAG